MNTKLIKKISLLFLPVFLFIILYCIFTWDSNNWNGIANKDNTIFEKIINRIYFTLSTVTTVGYGNMSANSIKCRILVILQMLTLIIGFTNLFI